LKILEEETISVNGKEWWFVHQFAKITGRKEQAIRVLISKGNLIRKLKTLDFGGKPLIAAEELFEFPFVMSGRQPDGMICYEQYVLENGQLKIREKCVNRQCQ